MSRFDAVNIGAAGTFVVRRSVSRTTFRSELERTLPTRNWNTMMAIAAVLGPR